MMPKGFGLTFIDHLTHNLYFGNMAEVVGLLRAPVQLPRDPLLRHQGRQDRPAVEGDDRAGRHGAHPAQRIERPEVADQRIPRRLQRRGHPAHRLLHRRHLRDGRSDARGGRASSSTRRTPISTSIDERMPEPWRRRGAPAQEQDPDRRRPRRPSSASCCRSSPRTRSARSSSRSSSARATKASAKATSRRCSKASSATRCGAACCDVSGHDHGTYQSGFGNEFATEAIAGRAAGGPQLAAARAVRPVRRAAVRHGVHRAAARRTGAAGCTASARRPCMGPSPRTHTRASTTDFGDGPVTPDQLRWNPLPLPTAPTDFIDGLFTMAGNGSPEAIPASASISMPPTARWTAVTSTTPTARC